MEHIISLLHEKPELPLFMALVLGQIIGRFKIKEFSFGPVVGTLIAGLIIGIPIKPEYPDLIRWSFFYLFLFGIGYGVGPQFFSSLRKDTMPLVLLAVVVAVAGVSSVLLMTALFKFDVGTAVGLLSGGMTQSAALGTGLSAINALPIDPALKATLTANAPLADATTYGFGDLGLFLWLVVIGPWILRISFRKECEALAAKMAGTTENTKTLLTPPQFSFRAYRVEKPSPDRATVGSLEKNHAGDRLAVQRVVRKGRDLKVRPELALHEGDQVVLAARGAFFQNALETIGPEVTDPSIVNVPLSSVAVVVKSKNVARHTLDQLASQPAVRDAGRGVFVQSIKRGSEPIPLQPGTVIEAGDVVQIVGSPADVERAISLIGFREYDPEKTSIALIAGCIAIGIGLGFLAITVGGVPIGLGTSGSILVVGLVAGWLRGRTPAFGAVPEPARRLLTDIGLIIFVAIIGLTAGPHAITALHERGLAFFGKVFFSGIVVTIAGPLAGTLVGHWVFKMNPVILLSGIAGSQTCTPGLNALRDAGGNNVAVLGYPVTYAIGNVLLTVAGPIVVAIVYGWGH
ncbi:MAG: TrkA C-terminal domain-containing protein [Nibricoccus sp.]